MRCPEVEDLLPLLAGGDLPKELCEAVDEHLLGCAPCARSRDGYRSALAGLALLRDDAMPPEFWSQLSDRIVSAAARQTPAAPVSLFRARGLTLLRGGFPQLAAAAAVFLVGIGLGFFVLEHGGPAAGTRGADGVARVQPDAAPAPGLGAPNPTPSRAPSFARFQPASPRATPAGGSRHVYGLSDVPAPDPAFTTKPGGLEVLLPPQGPRYGFSLEEIHTVSSEDVTVGY
ncbi:MAG: zf-HC2 domain-containing protein [Planctomycetes bacterium]|nr:zf-HC2 domain-containing protein [Planctomycetota bacterium]